VGGLCSQIVGRPGGVQILLVPNARDLCPWLASVKNYTTLNPQPRINIVRTIDDTRNQPSCEYAPWMIVPETSSARWREEGSDHLPYASCFP
jgi:hypothetical protein